MASRSTGWCTRLVWLGFTLPSLAPTSLAQTPSPAAISGQVLTPSGQPAVSAQVRVCPITAMGAPCTPLTTLYTNSALTVQQQNPLATDAYGNYKAFLAAGLYLLQVTLAPQGPIYTYYASAGSSSGGGSSPPQNSVQIAGPVAGQFASDPNIFINPSLHILQTPELLVPGSGTGLIGLTDSTGGGTVFQTVQAATTSWTMKFPLAPPSLTGACLTSDPTGVETFLGCLLLTGGTLTGPLTVPTLTVTTSFNGEFYPSLGTTTIAQAISAAGTAGSVAIPANYAGTDTFSSNAANVQVTDHRPYNPTRSATYIQTPEPQTTLKAAMYGVRCDGTTDDTVAINNAVAALTILAGGAAIVSPPAVPATVELPQGSCIIRGPIVLNGWGSLVGSSNGTWLQAAQPWPGGAMVEVTTPYATIPGGLEASVNRVVKNINFRYSNNAYAITGISVFNQTGNSSLYPLPSGADPLHYQLPSVTIEGNTFYSLDTGVDVEDCGECVIRGNHIVYVRQGIVDGGNVYSLVVEGNDIQQGSYTFTPLTTGTCLGASPAPSVGVASCAELRWSCTGGTGQACTGGTIGQTQIVSPQGLTLADNTVTTFDEDLRAVNAQLLLVHHNTLDFGGAGAQGSGTPNSTVVLGSTVVDGELDHNYIANNQGGSTVAAVEVGAPTAAPTNTQTYNGLWITENMIQDYAMNPTSAGVSFDSGVYARRNVYLVNNQFYNQGYGLLAQHPLQYSLIRGNTGVSLTGSGALLALDATGATSFSGTVVADNTTPDNVLAVYDAAGGGYVLGYNQSGATLTAPYQLLGSQTAEVAGCTITSGAIGNTCGSAATLTWPTPFADSSYTVQCSVQSPTYPTGIGVMGIVNGGSVSVNEVALSASSVGGGSIICTGTHQ